MTGLIRLQFAEMQIADGKRVRVKTFFDLIGLILRNLA